jgi:hypothetical protein
MRTTRATPLKNACDRKSWRRSASHLMALSLVLFLGAPADAWAGRRNALNDMSESDRNAIRFLEKHRASDKYAQFAIGSIYKRNGDADHARRWLTQSADAGNPSAKALLSSMESEQMMASNKATAIKVTSRRSMAGSQ